MNEIAIERQCEFKVFSMHDKTEAVTEPYFPSAIFKGFGAKKIRFIVKAWQYGIKSRVVVLSHINLLLPGYLIRVFSPKTKLILIAHGIEVWQPLSFLKKRMLQKVDLILPVSHFTKEKMKELFHFPEEKFSVLNNCLDPFLPPPANEASRSEWRKKYGIEEEEIVLMTLARLSAKEKNKNYDKVLSAIKKLKPELPQLKYLFVGKYEEEEKQRLDNLIHSLGLDGKILFTGFVPDNELSFYYNMADIYIMPSEKEGFGISFIEAMYYSVPVIAGNRDGTTDALLNGQLGTLIDPRSEEEIIEAIKKIISNKSAFTPDRKLLENNFSYPVYKEKWRAVLEQVEALR
jgi:phosphatidyl-myo-inositol dimannoside synthase